MNSQTQKVLLVAGARPNFMKVAPLIRAFQKEPGLFDVRLVHTGQHYDFEMSSIFFDELQIPDPDEHLNVGSGTHAEQTAGIMVAFERVCLREKPDLVIVVGDVNSTVACAITAKKLGIRVAHVEAGLRSRDFSMPEEINRVLTDSISDFLFTPSRDADRNLEREGIEAGRIHFVGNVMVDCLLSQLPRIGGREIVRRLNLQAGSYAVLTLHRPANVDDPEIFAELLDTLTEVSRYLPIVWPLHPRTRNALDRLGGPDRLPDAGRFRLIDPVGYLDMQALNRNARLILTDSGGLQEEATLLKVPCVTLRDSTERPVTVTAGANRVVGRDRTAILRAVSELSRGTPDISTPERWDGRASERIVQVLASLPRPVPCIAQ